MKASIKSVLLFTLVGVSLNVVTVLPALAQSKLNGCDNISTSRDKTPKPDSRCQHAASDPYRNQKALELFAKFTAENPPKRITPGPNGNTIYDGVDSNGEHYRIVSGPNGIATSGSAPSGMSINRVGTGSTGSGGGRKPR